MNKTTNAIRKKGYALKEFCDKHLIAIRTYRRYEKPVHAMHETLNRWIDELEVKS